MKYISKSKLMRLIANYRQWGDTQILCDLEELPEEDVSPVKTGKWAACGLGKRGKRTWKYCPRCGAKMEVETK